MEGLGEAFHHTFPSDTRFFCFQTGFSIVAKAVDVEQRDLALVVAIDFATGVGFVPLGAVLQQCQLRDKWLAHRFFVAEVRRTERVVLLCGVEREVVLALGMTTEGEEEETHR